MLWLVFIPLAYLLGAIPFGLLIGRLHGVDIRQHGSGNIGATNVGRVLGKKWGYLCLAADLLKGMAPTLGAGMLFQSSPDSANATTLLLWLAVGLAAVLGHVYPVYLGFRGGKGVSTTIGVALGIFPYFTIAMLAGLVAYAAVRLATGWVSLGSIALAIVFPAALAGYFAYRGQPFEQTWPLHVGAITLGVLIVVRHRSNIARIVRGTEPKAT